MTARLISITLILFSITPNMYGQLIDELPRDENGRLIYTEVVQADDTTVDELYLRAKQFFVESFKSANDVIQLDDKESGIVSGKAFQDIYIAVMGTSTKIQLWYTIKILSREGRYKYEIYDILFKSYPSSQMGIITTPAEDMFDKSTYYKNNGKARGIQEQYKDQTVSAMNTLQVLIKASMNKVAADSSEGDDW